MAWTFSLGCMHAHEVYEMLEFHLQEKCGKGKNANLKGNVQKEKSRVTPALTHGAHEVSTCYWRVNVKS